MTSASICKLLDEEIGQEDKSNHLCLDKNKATLLAGGGTMLFKLVQVATIGDVGVEDDQKSNQNGMKISISICKTKEENPDKQMPHTEFKTVIVNHKCKQQYDGRCHLHSNKSSTANAAPIFSPILSPSSSPVIIYDDADKQSIKAQHKKPFHQQINKSSIFLR
ncbi:c-X-C motif chemokine 14-like protein [Corchorus capsularis]|uniref:C-X-C motif chemokine 14-like protein n=1 Tax=Corchorus capsularis TaxID=210143 RepID=A0A1R3G514_COCAP|nr:c-X-C motif chemokine 14-like protein [Corchorus capsularis]